MFVGKMYDPSRPTEIRITMQGDNATMDANGFNREQIVHILWNSLVAVASDDEDLTMPIQDILKGIGGYSDQ